MLKHLMPQDGKFFELFNAHAALVVESGRELAALVAGMTSPGLDIAEHARAIVNIEKRGDKVTRDTVALLHRTFNTPLHRDEIHKLISRMDDILDLIQDVAESMHLYDVRVLTQEARQLADISVSCCERVKQAVAMLPNVADAAVTLKICAEIDQLESDADRVMRSGMSKLFREEDDVRQVIKIKAIYELLEMVTDRCEDVANLIEGIVLENS